MSEDAGPPSETSAISFEVVVNTVPKTGKTIEMRADPLQRQALAKVHGLEEIISFSADVNLAPWRMDGFRLEGRIRARIEQLCIASLERVENEIDEEIDLTLLPGNRDSDRSQTVSHEVDIELEGADEPERFDHGMIDVGAIAEEFFALAIDPYPRKEGAGIDKLSGDAVDDQRPSPFAALAELKRDR